MIIPRFWARASGSARSAGGDSFDLHAWGGSTVSKLDAERAARDRLQRLVNRVQQEGELPDRYIYPERMMREEVIRELREGASAAAVVTRNLYGCLILNTNRLMFVDIDRAPAKGGLLSRLFGGGKKAEVETAGVPDSLSQSLSTLRGSFRVYQTAAGWRVLATDRPYQPDSKESQQAMQAMDADPAFVKLCRVQQSFRARLTPKPWRCECSKPPGTHPREDAGVLSQFRDWLARYQQATQRMATCRFLGSVGPNAIAPEFKPLIEFHDAETRARESLPLA